VSVTATDAGVQLRSDLSVFRVAGADAEAFLARVVPLLDGSRNEEAIAEALSGYSRASVRALLDGLRARGLVEEAPRGAVGRSGQREVFRAWSREPAEAEAALQRACVLVAGHEPWGTTATLELAAAGVGTVRACDDVSELESELAAGPWRLLVAAISPCDASRIEHVAILAHRAGVLSLWSHLSGRKAILGPLVTPGRTACRVCANAEALNPELVDRREPAAPKAAAALLGHLVAMEAVRVISAYAPSPLGGRLLIEDLASSESSLHTLVRLPRCRVCGA
jgi:molybdopterin/thiamine biosynthesis adenylyltransferase